MKRLVVVVTTVMLLLNLVTGEGWAVTALTNVSDTVTNTKAGATAVTHTVAFTTTTALTANAGNKYTISFANLVPSGLACANVTVTGITGGTCSLAGSVFTYTFPGAVAASTAATFKVTSTTNPSPGAGTSYTIPITVSQSGSTTTDTGTAVVFIFAANTATSISLDDGLTFTVTNTPAGNTLLFDLTPSVTPRDIGKSTALNVIANTKNGFTVTVIASKQLTHTAYAGNTVPNSWGGTPTLASAWSNGQTGFGYSLDGAVTYKSFDTVTARTVYTSAGVTGSSGAAQTVNYRVEVDYAVPAGIYTTTITYLCTPTY